MSDVSFMTLSQLQATLDIVMHNYRCWSPRPWRGKPTKMILELGDRLQELTKEIEKRRAM